jgi:hypothetical protein
MAPIAWLHYYELDVSFVVYPYSALQKHCCEIKRNIESRRMYDAEFNFCVLLGIQAIVSLPDVVIAKQILFR